MCLFILSVADGHIRWFCILAIVNRTSANIDVQVLLWSFNLDFCKYTTKSRRELADLISYIFSFLRKLHTDFHTGCMKLLPAIAVFKGFPLSKTFVRIYFFCCFCLCCFCNSIQTGARQECQSRFDFHCSG